MELDIIPVIRCTR